MRPFIAEYRSEEVDLEFDIDQKRCGYCGHVFRATKTATSWSGSVANFYVHLRRDHLVRSDLAVRFGLNMPRKRTR